MSDSFWKMMDENETDGSEGNEKRDKRSKVGGWFGRLPWSRIRGKNYASQ